jgi:hypothetical protein
MSLPGIGPKGVNKILELRDAKGDLELEDLNQVPYLRLTPADLLLYPPVVGLSMKIASSSLYSASNISGDSDLPPVPFLLTMIGLSPF